MRYFPAFFNFANRPVFVVGDGELAARKIRLLTKASPLINIFSVSEGSLVEQEFGADYVCFRRDLRKADLEFHPGLIFIAVEDEKILKDAVALAKRARIPVNVVDRPELCDFVVPSIIERGDVAIGISTGGAAPVLSRRLREKIESLLPARLGELVSFVKDRRPRIADRIALRDRRGFYERLLSSPISEAVLDGDMKLAEAGFEAALDADTPLPGSIHIVGAGPGDPELLTLKALRVMQEADVVLFDNLVSDAVLDLVRRDAERVYVGKRRADHSMSQSEIGERMISLAKEGKRVVRLKGGDPFIFGRGGEELDQIKAAGLAANVVPGITAATGCASSASVPLTHRGVSQAVSFVTAYAGKGGAPDIDWQALARLRHTLVVYMGVSRAGEVSANMIAGGRAASTPVAVIEKGTTDEQRILKTTLSAMPGDMLAANITGPAVLIIGEVADFADGAGLIQLSQQTELAA
ncbi:siroheme synthase CysG [Parvularcula marina]|uniref:siroheme synthase CysG n=1 Tax=Parvularcula marina TaxID=2292771 RepID=UPI0035192BF7